MAAGRPLFSIPLDDRAVDLTGTALIMACAWLRDRPSAPDHSRPALSHGSAGRRLVCFVSGRCSSSTPRGLRDRSDGRQAALGQIGDPRRPGRSSRARSALVVPRSRSRSSRSPGPARHSSPCRGVSALAAVLRVAFDPEASALPVVGFISPLLSSPGLLAVRVMPSRHRLVS